MSHLDRFPTLSPQHYETLLRIPSGRVRCVIDTDTRNEIDDQFALAWAFLSQDMLDIEAVYAAPYSFRNRLDELREAKSLLDANPNSQETVVQRYRAQIERLQAKGVDIADDAQLDPQNVTMVSPAEGMEKSYQEILIVLEKMGMTDSLTVLRGSDHYLESHDTPVESEAVTHLIETARRASPDDPLYIVAIGAPTNVASALLLAPDIINNVVVR
ncbi:MAG: nucleoside hydrolase [Chloroflexota bacterium]